jgi:glycosyltransferase involved in cell wall biosynthesis
MNWLHRRQRLRPSGLRHFLRAEYGNFLLAHIRSRLASGVVYQSEFSRAWWERVYGETHVPSAVVYNGVDLDQYTPQGDHQRPDDCCRLLLVEGSLMGGYEAGLAAAVGLAEGLAAQLERVELMIVGRVADSIQAEWTARTRVPIHWVGLAPRERIPEIDRSSHLLYSSDINAACPNSVVEALACGLPVASFDTGALPELLAGDAGRIVPYGGDPWKLEPPDVPALATAALEIYKHQERFRQTARALAEALFGLDRMVDGYLQALGVL